MSEVATVISTLGFPIVCCLGMAYYINTTLKEFSKIMSEHTTALEKLSMIIDEHCKDGK